MRLLSAHIVGFRRFADLTIQGLPQTAKLVVLVGSNGSGKSSFFDALLLRYRMDTDYGWNADKKYYDRSKSGEANIAHRVTVATDKGVKLTRGSFYFRSAYRNDHEFASNTLKRQGEILETVSLNRMIEPDATVSSNYQRLASQAMEDVFVNEASKTTMGVYRRKLIGSIQAPLKRLFPDLIFVGVGNPLDQGTFQFDKGESKGFDYKNLSGGEKASFDLILDFAVKRRSYVDAIYCIDEPEAHMNTRLQGQLLSELVGLLPGDSQLWIASHSIGMMRKARELYDADPSSVAFIDFGGHNFDNPVTLKPSKPTRAFWESVMNVALDDLAALVVPKHVIVCEGNPAGQVPGKNAEHDARIYFSIFEEEMPDTTFVAAGNSLQVQSDFIGLAAVLPKLAAGIKVTRLIDLDDHTPSGTLVYEAEGIRVLSRRHIESYLYDDEVLAALCTSVGEPEKLTELIAAKAAALAKVAVQGNPPDDIKKAAGEIYNAAKKLLSLKQKGSDASAFARETLSKLVRPEMRVYQELKADIFGT